MIDHTLKLELTSDRHLVVGDLHGRYDQLMQLLQDANYNPKKDILYSVGDLIDRQPKSVECVEFFLQDRCYAIKGNHEHMALYPKYYDIWLTNGGMACLNSLAENNKELPWLLDVIKPFPYVIDVGEDNEENAFRIIHAEMPPAWPEEYFQAMLDMALNDNDPSFARCIWSRQLITAAAANVAQGLPADNGIEFNEHRYRTVFTGHTPCRAAFSCGDHWFLDTWKGGKTTLIDAITKETWTVDSD